MVIVAPPLLAPALTALIICGYIASLWWLLRRESLTVKVGVLAVCGLALCLRLVYLTDFPPGYNDDEANFLWSADQLRHAGRLFGRSSIHYPAFLKVLFEAGVYQYVPGFWAVRGCSMAFSVLATAAAFATARGFRLRLAASFATAVFVASLPWSLLWGRMMMGGQLTFDQFLLLAALGRILWSEGGLPEVAIGGFGLSLLCYDYLSGQAMLGLPLLAAIVARGWRARAYCLATLLFGVTLWGPYIYENHWNALASVEQSNHLIGDAASSMALLTNKAHLAIQAFVSPVAKDSFTTISAGAMHPPLILALALLGSIVSGPRRFLFLWGGFIGGLMPAVVFQGIDVVTAKRMLTAYPFVALAASIALDRLGDRRWGRMVIALVAGTIAAQSIRLYFSPTFWPLESRSVFDPDKSALINSLPPPWATRPHLIADRQLGYVMAVPHYENEPLTVTNWFPPDGMAVTYLFDNHAELLASFYENLFGAARVSRFGWAFRVDLEAGNWSWLRQHGWNHEVQCADHMWQGQVPTLYTGVGWDYHAECPQAATYIWRGRWDGPPSTLRLLWSGRATVDTPAGRVVERDGWEQSADFRVDPGASVTVSVLSPSAGIVALVAVNPLAGRNGFYGQVPAWEDVTPDGRLLFTSVDVSAEQLRIGDGSGASPVGSESACSVR